MFRAAVLAELTQQVHEDPGVERALHAQCSSRMTACPLGCARYPHTLPAKCQWEGSWDTPTAPPSLEGGQVEPMPVFNLEAAALISFSFLDDKHLQSLLVCRESISFRKRESSRVADSIGFVLTAFPAAAFKCYLLISRWVVPGQNPNEFWK